LSSSDLATVIQSAELVVCPLDAGKEFALKQDIHGEEKPPQSLYAVQGQVVAGRREGAATYYSAPNTHFARS
jgi:hypothetical protein